MDEMINVFINKDNLIKKSDLNTNAVLVHLFPKVDEDGNRIYERIITICCVDEEMLEPLRYEAGKILLK